MISWLNSWAQGIIVAVVIATIIELILPEGSCKKYVKVVIGIYILFTIIAPVIGKVSKKDIDINDILNTQKYEQEISKNNNDIYKKFESNNSRTIKDIYVSNLETDIKSKLKDKGYEVINTYIKVKNDKNYSIDKISVDVVKKENSKQNEKENKNESIENISINIQISNDKNSEESKTVSINETEKQNIKKYLSDTYQLEETNIKIN